MKIVIDTNILISTLMRSDGTVGSFLLKSLQGYEMLSRLPVDGLEASLPCPTPAAIRESRPEPVRSRLRSRHLT
jgi:hypothetical protein